MKELSWAATRGKGLLAAGSMLVALLVGVSNCGNGATSTGPRGTGGSITGGETSTTTSVSTSGGTSTTPNASGGSASQGGSGGSLPEGSTGGSTPVQAGGQKTGGTPSSDGGAVGGGAPTGGTSTVHTGGTTTVSTGGVGSGGAKTGGTVVPSGGTATGGTVAATGGSTETTLSAGCANADKSGATNIDVSTVNQTIDGFGGVNIMQWGVEDLTSDQVTKAFGTGAGQLGLTILRILVPSETSGFAAYLPTAKAASALGAKVIAAAWSPPAAMKDNGKLIGGHLNTSSYGPFADYLMSFVKYMSDNSTPLYGISVQNEPDWNGTYDSCVYSAAQMTDFVKNQGSKFTNVKLMAAESYKFDKAMTDGILNDATAVNNLSIVTYHVYGASCSDYPLARQKGKAIWMSEHVTDSTNDANVWPKALDVAKEMHSCLTANVSAYLWWYIRRSYGLLTEDGNASKRGYIMAHYAKFVRPGYVRVAASNPSASNVLVTAYKNASKLVVVIVNMNSSTQNITLNIKNTCINGFDRYTTSASKSMSTDPPVSLSGNQAAVTLDASSVTTFVSN